MDKYITDNAWAAGKNQHIPAVVHLVASVFLIWKTEGEKKNTNLPCTLYTNNWNQCFTVYAQTRAHSCEMEKSESSVLYTHSRCVCWAVHIKYIPRLCVIPLDSRKGKICTGIQLRNKNKQTSTENTLRFAFFLFTSKDYGANWNPSIYTTKFFCMHTSFTTWKNIMCLLVAFVCWSIKQPLFCSANCFSSKRFTKFFRVVCVYRGKSVKSIHACCVIARKPFQIFAIQLTLFGIIKVCVFRIDCFPTD